MIYLDHAASTPPLEGCLEHLNSNRDLLIFNPSSPHSPAREIRQLMDGVRENIAKELQVEKKNILFTSGATESNNTILKSFKDSRILCDGSSHSSVFEVVKSFPKSLILDLSCNTDEIIYQIDNVVRDNDLISLIHVNNETGEKINIEKIGQEIKRKKNAFIHLDAVQSFLKHPIDLKNTPIDFLSASFHKVGGLKGGGFIYARDPSLLTSLIQGGDQENGLRAGTENTLSILSFQAPLQYWPAKRKNNFEQVLKLKQLLIKKLKNKNIEYKIFNAPEVSPYITNISFTNTKSHQPIKSEVLVRCLGDKNIFLSNSSACYVKKKNNRVLLSKKMSSEYIEGAVRISLSPQTTEGSIGVLTEELKKIIEEFF